MNPDRENTSLKIMQFFTKVFIMKKLQTFILLMMFSKSYSLEKNNDLPSLNELTQELACIYKPVSPQLMTSEQADKKAQKILQQLKKHPDAHKPLCQITKKQDDLPEHDAVYLKFDIFKYLLYKESISNQYKDDIKKRHNDIYDCEEWDKQNPAWGYRGNNDTTLDVQYFWSPRLEINLNYWLSKGSLSASRYYADTVHKGLMNPRSHQIASDEPYNPDPENNFTMLDLLSIVEQAEMLEAEDWKKLDEEITSLETDIHANYEKCLKLYSDQATAARQSRNPKAAFVAACRSCIEKK